MTGTKAEILALLKRNGGHSVSELAGALRLSPVTVRQHITRLQRDGLVTGERKAAHNGRSHYLFRLTAKAHAAAFPARTDRMLQLLVREVGYLEGSELDGLSAGDKAALVLRRLAQRLAGEYAPMLRGWTLEERVIFAAEVMHADGGFAEWEATARGYEIRDFNCPFHRLLEGAAPGAACAWHRSFLSELLGEEIRVTPCPDSGRCCRYIIEEAPVAAATA
jgi:predicted ArsR family transcriptional regulator